MKKNYDAFTRFCMAMGIDNDNCVICPLRGECDAMPHKGHYENEADYETAYATWSELANARAEMAAETFGIEIREGRRDMMNRNEMHTILDAVLDAIEQDKTFVELKVTSAGVNVGAGYEDDNTITWEFIERVNADTARRIVDGLKEKEA